MVGRRFLQKVASSRNHSVLLRFWEKSEADSADTLWVKNFVEIALSPSVSEINMFFAFNTEIQDGRQKWRENIF